MGTLDGYSVIEMGGIGPAPFAGMLLADMGAEVIRIERKDAGLRFVSAKYEIMNRGKKSVLFDLKNEDDRELVLRLIDTADVLIDPFRPGVMEKFGFSPKILSERNPKLVYGRITGYGQTGALANFAGHDIDYLSISGALSAIGSKDKPSVPLNLIADFGAGGMLLLNGILAALLEREKSGKGQVVDAAMVDGVAQMMSLFYGYMQAGFWSVNRESNLIDGGTPYYNVYETKDGKFIALGALEPQFYQRLIDLLKPDKKEFEDQLSAEKWPAQKEQFSRIFKQKTRDEWTELLFRENTCVAPVLNMQEAIEFEPNKSRSVFIEQQGVVQPAPAPRFTRTPSKAGKLPEKQGQDTLEIIHQLKISKK